MMKKRHRSKSRNVKRKNVKRLQKMKPRRLSLLGLRSESRCGIETCTSIPSTSLISSFLTSSQVAITKHCEALSKASSAIAKASGVEAKCHSMYRPQSENLHKCSIINIYIYIDHLLSRANEMSRRHSVQIRCVKSFIDRT